MGETNEPIVLCMPPEEHADASVLEAAAGVLRRRYGKLIAGDLISGLTGAAASLRANDGIIRPQSWERLLQMAGL